MRKTIIQKCNQKSQDTCQMIIHRNMSENACQNNMLKRTWEDVRDKHVRRYASIWGKLWFLLPGFGQKALSLRIYGTPPYKFNCSNKKNVGNTCEWLISRGSFGPRYRWVCLAGWGTAGSRCQKFWSKPVESVRMLPWQQIYITQGGIALQGSLSLPTGITYSWKWRRPIQHRYIPSFDTSSYDASWSFCGSSTLKLNRTNKITRSVSVWVHATTCEATGKTYFSNFL